MRRQRVRHDTIARPAMVELVRHVAAHDGPTFTAPFGPFVDRAVEIGAQTMDTAIFAAHLARRLAKVTGRPVAGLVDDEWAELQAEARSWR